MRLNKSDNLRVCHHLKPYFAGFELVAAFKPATDQTNMLGKSVNGQTMSGYSRREIYDQLFCLSSQSFSFSHVKERKKENTFSESAANISATRPPAHFDSGTSQPNKPTSYLFMSADIVEALAVT